MQDYLWIQKVYFMLRGFDHALVAWIKQGLLDSDLRSIPTWRYIQKKCKINLFKALTNCKVFYWQSLEEASKEGITSCTLKDFLKTPFCDRCSRPSGVPVLTAFLPPSCHPSSCPLPPQGAAPFFPPGHILFLSGELHIFSNVGQFSFSHFFIPQHGAPRSTSKCLINTKNAQY